MLSEITPLVITFNEAVNIGRTLDALSWARRVVVLDSGSIDDTKIIATRYANVDWYERAFDNHAAQCNYALDKLVNDAVFVMSLDADYVVTDGLRDELAALKSEPDVAGYWISFRYCVQGIPLRGTLYPERICLYRPESARYQQHGHTQRVQITGRIERLSGVILHDDRKSDSNFIRRQHRYAEMEANFLLGRKWRDLDWRKKIRRLLVVAPWLVPAYVLVGKGLILDGKPGWRYAYERFIAEYLIARELVRQSRQGKPK